ncbi:mitochondrial processing peptidase [Cyathus striatus]|nr:mitochondrial processing peptidase [Cyathus striatus]
MHSKYSFGDRRRPRALRHRNIHTAASDPTVQITTLPNKIRVATEATPGHFSSVGLYIDAGSRYETPQMTGVSHFLDRMAFKSTSNRSDAEMTDAIHSLGGHIMCSSSRESMAYQSSHFNQATPIALSLISDTVLDPAFLPEEVEAQRDAAFYELREISAKPDLILPEILHDVAYGGQGLGNPLLCPEERIPLIDQSTLRAALREWYKPERMVIAGAGIPHQELVELVDKYFSALKPSTNLQPPLSRTNTSPQVPSHLLSPSSPNSSTSTYTGGHRFIHSPESEFNHLYIAYEGVGIHDDDIYALATMQVLLGGGGSFSAGGPGKGMYSRLYTHILNHYPQIDHCASFHHIYTDSSLFGLFATFVPASGDRRGNTPAEILPHLVHQLSLLLYSPIPSVELSRAKNQLKSSLIMALESRAVEVEDLGRQVLVHGRKVPVSEMTAKIDAVKTEDIRRVATRIFGPQSGNKPSLVCMGHEDTGSAAEIFRKYGIGST